MAADTTDRLVLLKSMKGHKVAAGDHDIRGWDVVTADHKRIGAVDDLVVDTEALKVRYAVLRVDQKILGTKSDSHLLIPIAGAALDASDKRVYLDDIDSERLLTIPPYDNRRITREYERQIRDMFQWGGSSGRSGGGDFYDHPAYEEGRVYRRRRADFGDASAPPGASATAPVDGVVDPEVRQERLEEAERLRQRPADPDDDVIKR